MYFNGKNDTSIDGEFNENKNILSSIKNFFNKYKKIILISIVLIIVFGAIGLLFLNKKNNNYLILSGEEIVTIYQGADYIEPGYNAYNSRDDDLTSKVTIESNLNNNVIGEYEIRYKIGDVIKVRYVNVIKRPSDYLFIHLTSVNNSVDVYLQKGEQYKEPGYMAITTSGKDLTNKVTVTGKVDTSKKGTYKLTYSVVDLNNVTISVSRKVMVLDSDISLSLNTDKYTNAYVTINAYVIDEYFDYMILPNNEKVTTNRYSYKVSNNGTYTFKTYSKKDSVKEKSIKVSNIDKVTPNGSCSGSYKDGVSTININASDNIGIDRYVINGKSYTSKNITINSELKTANVTIYDKAGNSKNISCKIVDNSSSKPIKPGSNANIIKHSETDTLKVWIELNQRSGRINYYTTYIWAKNPYKQFKSQVPDNFGNELVNSKKLLENAVKQQNLDNKLAVAVNASGFILNGVWGQSYYNANKKFNMTAGSPIVIVNGEVKRDLANGNLPSGVYTIYGMNKKGVLSYYNYAGGNNYESNKMTSQKIINDGVLNTFAFNPVVVYDGKLKSSDTARNVRQGFCQIDSNNFVFITDKYSDSRNGFSMKELGEYMISLGCKYGFNLDGGGSTSLIYKEKNGQPESITNPGRNIADIIYFHE